MRKACCSAVRGGNVKRAATLVESPGNRFSDAGSIPAISTRKKAFVILTKTFFNEICLAASEIITAVIVKLLCSEMHRAR